MRAGQPHATRDVIHLGDEIGLIAAHRLGNRHGNVIGRLDDEDIERVLEGNGAVHRQTRLARRQVERLARNGHRRVERHIAGSNFLESHIGRHQFGQRCRVPGQTRVLGIEHVQRCPVRQKQRRCPGWHQAGENEHQGN